MVQAQYKSTRKANNGTTILYSSSNYTCSYDLNFSCIPELYLRKQVDFSCRILWRIQSCIGSTLRSEVDKNLTLELPSNELLFRALFTKTIIAFNSKLRENWNERALRVGPLRVGPWIDSIYPTPPKATLWYTRYLLRQQYPWQQATNTVMALDHYFKEAREER